LSLLTKLRVPSSKFSGVTVTGALIACDITFGLTEDTAAVDDPAIDGSKNSPLMTELGPARHVTVITT